MNPVPCLTPGCNTDSRWRGLCSRCYGQAKRLIEKGETTWEELMGLGLAKPNVDQLFTTAFYAKRKTESADLRPVCTQCEQPTNWRRDDGGALVCEHCNGPL